MNWLYKHRLWFILGILALMFLFVDHLLRWLM
jgi:hypothetical protein